MFKLTGRNTLQQCNYQLQINEPISMLRKKECYLLNRITQIKVYRCNKHIGTDENQEVPQCLVT